MDSVCQCPIANFSVAIYLPKNIAHVLFCTFYDDGRIVRIFPSDYCAILFLPSIYLFFFFPFYETAQLSFLNDIVTRSNLVSVQDSKIVPVGTFIFKFKVGSNFFIGTLKKLFVFRCLYTRRRISAKLRQRRKYDGVA